MLTFAAHNCIQTQGAAMYDQYVKQQQGHYRPDVSGLLMSVNSKHKEEAFKVMAFVISNAKIRIHLK